MLYLIIRKLLCKQTHCDHG